MEFTQLGRDITPVLFKSLQTQLQRFQENFQGMEKFEEHVVIWITRVKILIAIFSEMKAHISKDTIANLKVKLLFKQE